MRSLHAQADNTNTMAAKRPIIDVKQMIGNGETSLYVDGKSEKRYPAGLFSSPSCGCSSVDRVLASEAKGRWFDSSQPHQIPGKSSSICVYVRAGGYAPGPGIQESQCGFVVQCSTCFFVMFSVPAPSTLSLPDQFETSVPGQLL